MAVSAAVVAAAVATGAGSGAAAGVAARAAATDAFTGKMSIPELPLPDPRARVPWWAPNRVGPVVVARGPVPNAPAAAAARFPGGALGLEAVFGRFRPALSVVPCPGVATMRWGRSLEYGRRGVTPAPFAAVPSAADSKTGGIGNPAAVD